MINDKKQYNLEERTAVYAETVIEFLRKLPNDSVNSRMINQCSGSVGSIGANYCEATEAESKKDFIHKMSIAKKEIKETLHWLRLLTKANPTGSDIARNLWKEGQELLLIFSSSIQTAKNKMVGN